MDGKIAPNEGEGPVRVTATGEEDVDLGAATSKVNDAKTPHREKVAPGLAVVLFAKLDKDSAKKAEEAVGKVKGVAKKGAKANAEKGEISVKLTGDAKVKSGDLVDALKGAGVEARTTK